MPHVHQISISQGGVPKLPIPRARITTNGVEGDVQANREHHGGPERAVCLFALSIIDDLRAQGHPIVPGSAGENLTLADITCEQWGSVQPGARLKFSGGVELEIASYCQPCSKIRESFREGQILLIKQAVNPGRSRVYARVITEGAVATGESVEFQPGAPVG